MTKQTPKILDSLSGPRILYPVLIGLAVVMYMLYREFNNYPDNPLSGLELTKYTIIWLLVSFLMMFVRDLGYVIRIRILSDNYLSWRKSLNVILLWEFASAVTPSAIGGTGVAIFFLNKEGINVGKSSAIVMATSFLDELYFIVMFPLLLLTIKFATLFAPGGDNLLLNEFLYFALVGYFVKFCFTIFVAYGLFVNPRGLKWLLLWIFKLTILRKWRHGANQTGTDLILASKELRNKPFLFWFKAGLATFFSWSARYLVVNCILLAFALNFDHFLLFARQLVMWIMMLISPTPGGSGFSEFVFTKYLGDIIVIAVPTTMAFLWRLITYYPYLVIGTFIVPRWIKTKFNSKQQ